MDLEKYTSPRTVVRIYPAKCSICILRCDLAKYFTKSLMELERYTYLPSVVTVICVIIVVYIDTWFTFIPGDYLSVIFLLSSVS